MGIDDIRELLQAAREANRGNDGGSELIDTLEMCEAIVAARDAEIQRLRGVVEAVRGYGKWVGFTYPTHGSPGAVDAAERLRATLREFAAAEAARDPRP